MDVRELQTALKNRLGDRTRFMGVYTSDQIPFIIPSRRPITMIVNTLKSTSSINVIGHWVVFYIEFHPKKRIVFYDSYGISPHDYGILGFSKFISQYKNTPLYDYGIQFQPDTSRIICINVHSLCFLVWIRSIYWLYTDFLF